MEKSKEGKKKNIRMQLSARIVTVENSAYVKDSEARQAQLQVGLDVERQQLGGKIAGCVPDFQLRNWN